MSINLFTTIATIVNFIILYFVLRHFLFQPVNNVINTRQSEINTNIKKAKEDREKAESLKVENEQKLKDSKDEGRKIVEEYKVRAEKLSDNLVKDAKDEAQLVIERARVEAVREQEKAKDEIKGQVVDLAILLSSKALNETIDEVQHRKLIDDFIAKAGI